MQRPGPAAAAEGSQKKRPRVGHDHWAVAALRRPVAPPADAGQVVAKRAPGASPRGEGAGVPSAATLHEVQETGEAMCFADDADFALGGVGEGMGRGVRRRSAMKLAELCLSHRGARLVQSQGLAPRFLAAAAGLAKSPDPVLRSTAGCLLYALGALGGDRGCLNAGDVLGVLGGLLDSDRAGAGGAGEPRGRTLPGQDVEARLRKLVLSRVVQPYSMPEALAEDAALGAAALALLALEAATTTATSSASAAVLSGEVKEKLEGAGVLEATAALLERNLGEQGLKNSWIGVKCLKVLENSTFLHQGNAEFLSRQPLLGRLLTVGCSWPREEQKAALLFLLNVTHEAAAGCRAACSGGGLNALVDLFLRLGGQTAGLGEDGAHEYELVNLLLGLLINVVEKDEALRSDLAALCRHEAAASPRGPAGPCADGGGLLHLLCRLIFAGQRVAEKAKAEEEVTADMVTTSEAKGESTINRAYASILLGFIICDDAPMKDAVARILPGESLESLVDALEEFSQFLNSVHAVTDGQAAALNKLLAKIRG